MYFAILSMSLLANSSVAAPPLPELTDEDELLCAWLFATGITFSLRDLSSRTPGDVLLATEEDPAGFVADAIGIFDTTTPYLTVGLLVFLVVLLLLPLLLLILAFTLSASFSWHIMFSRRLMGVDSGPKKSEMVLERVLRNASFRLREDLYGGLR